MTDEARKARAQALREWRHRNPDKAKAASERYWEKRAQQRMEESLDGRNDETTTHLDGGRSR